jgi:flagellar protein FlgJ
MGIESLGSYYLNSAAYTPLSQGNAASIADTAKSEKLFADILAKAEASQTTGTENQETPTLSSRKPVIDKTDKLYEQCEALETFLVKTLITGMRNTVQKSEFMDTGFAGKMYEDMLYDEYAKDFSKNANFGFAELAYLELTGQRGKIIAGHA